MHLKPLDSKSTPESVWVTKVFTDPQNKRLLFYTEYSEERVMDGTEFRVNCLPDARTSIGFLGYFLPVDENCYYGEG